MSLEAARVDTTASYDVETDVELSRWPRMCSRCYYRAVKTALVYTVATVLTAILFKHFATTLLYYDVARIGLGFNIFRT
jgi:hypothetical protein